MKLPIDLQFLRRPFERRTPPGSAPGTATKPEEETTSHMTVAAFGPEEYVEAEIDDPDDIREYLGNYDVTWIHVHGLGDTSKLRQLANMFDLHPLVYEDILHTHQRAKAEEYGDYSFLVVRMVEMVPRLDTRQLCLVVGENYVITIEEAGLDDLLDPIRVRLRKSVGRIRQMGPDYLSYALMDSVIDHYFPVVETFGDRLDEIDDPLAAGYTNDLIPEIQKISSDLLTIRRNLLPHKEAIRNLMSTNFTRYTANTIVFLRDADDHISQLLDAIDTYRQICSDLRDFHFALTSQRANEVTKTLTIIATVFIPLSFIAGVYGMNFENMPWINWKYGYIYCWGLMIAVGVAFLGWFYARGWFKG
ncbi:magnesium and cobalt transport protein CorA [Bremerella cremea]|uniref:Magnesium transport protein CorA n=1 Tax=Blastopirellula marina TaxID=124 RepID=A0A2S8FJW4_9BACT|nr:MULTISPECIES: magnesium/cobalt transporter CorA [Pirellulaceae]PQO32468.1 magnesium and cobalt transport protein CorA [Blastopirellula marina]RCS45535.1 magnesium and cobalt transport protein CorA [Bremerella cremea]